jgi:hypothetical protein
MKERKQKLHSEDDEPDDLVYKTTFLYQEDVNVELYEKIRTNKPLCLPEEGEYISFSFVVDEDGDEVFRADGTIPQSEISSDGEYDRMHSYDFKVENIRTKYTKHVSDEMSKTTTVEKVVRMSRCVDDHEVEQR